MEIGNQPIQYLEPIARVNKNIRPSRALPQCAILFCPALNGPAGRRSHTDHPSSIPLGLVDGFRCLRRNDTILAVHSMVRNLLRFYWAKGSQPHVERHIADFYPHFFNGIQQIFGKMQARRRGCRRANLPRIDRLIPFGILEFFFDIGRQRNSKKIPS